MGAYGKVRLGKLGEDFWKVPEEILFTLREPTAFVWVDWDCYPTSHDYILRSLEYNDTVKRLRGELVLPFIIPVPKNPLDIDFIEYVWVRTSLKQFEEVTKDYAPWGDVWTHILHGGKREEYLRAFQQLDPGPWVFLDYSEWGCGTDTQPGGANNTYRLRQLGVEPIKTVEWICWGTP